MAQIVMTLVVTRVWVCDILGEHNGGCADSWNRHLLVGVHIR